MTIPNRIKAHKKVRAGDLLRHELNPRVHNDEQRQALGALYRQVGFARSLLAYETSDGKLKLIDGHLRADFDPDMEVDVEILDVTDEEARALLLSIDPLAQLADYDNNALNELRQITETDDETLGALWASLQQKDKAVKEELINNTETPQQVIEEQYMVIITCKNEQEQIALLRRFKKEGLNVSAKTS